MISIDYQPAPDEHIPVGSMVKASTVGPGIVTGYSIVGFPMVNGAPVFYLETDEGQVYDPRGVFSNREIPARFYLSGGREQ